MKCPSFPLRKLKNIIGFKLFCFETDMVRKKNQYISIIYIYYRTKASNFLLIS